MLLFLALYLGAIVRRRGLGIVARRGMSVGADLGMLADTPRVRVLSVLKIGPDTVRIVLTPAPRLAEDAELPAARQMEFVVRLRDDEFGFEQLHEWKRSECSIAIVLPPDSHIVRLRSIDSLQPLTLRRVDE